MKRTGEQSWWSSCAAWVSSAASLLGSSAASAAGLLCNGRALELRLVDSRALRGENFSPETLNGFRFVAVPYFGSRLPVC